MSLINKTLTPEQIKKGTLATFNKAYSAAASLDWASAITGPAIRSTASKETHVGISPPPALTKWKDSLQPGLMEDYSIDVENLTYTATIETDEDTLADQQYDALRRNIEAMARRARVLKNKLAAEILEAGESTKGLDEQNFFSTAHPYIDPAIGAGQSNLLTTNAGLDETGLINAEKAFYALKDAQGELIGEAPHTILVPGALAYTAEKLLGQANLASGESNPLRRRYRVVVGPHLTDENDWYLIGGPAGSGLLVQERLAPTFNSADPSSTGNKNLTWIFWTKTRLAVFLGDWRSIIKNKN